MTTTLKNNTHIGLGFAVQTDPFQSGREAAQLAKNQLTGPEADLVLAFGPSHVHFKDFIEGVRLVTGESTLVGIPSSRVFTNELYAPETCVVVIVQSDSMRFSIAAARHEQANFLAPVTTLFSQLRSARGNDRTQYPHHGILVFDNSSEEPDDTLPLLLAAEAGLESWIATAGLRQENSHPLMCHDQHLDNGLVAVECLSHDPWGFGLVNINAFKDHPDVVKEGVKAALRDALLQTKNHTPSIGLFFFNFDTSKLDPSHLGSLFKTMQDMAKDVPFVGLATKHSFVRSHAWSQPTQDESIISLLMP